MDNPGAIRPGCGLRQPDTDCGKAHQHYASTTATNPIRRAVRIGPNTAITIERIMRERTYPEQGYRSSRPFGSGPDRRHRRQLLALVERGLDIGLLHGSPPCGSHIARRDYDVSSISRQYTTGARYQRQLRRLCCQFELRGGFGGKGLLFGPDLMFLQRPDDPLRHDVAFRLAHEGRRAFDAEEAVGRGS